MSFALPIRKLHLPLWISGYIKNISLTLDNYIKYFLSITLNLLCLCYYICLLLFCAQQLQCDSFLKSTKKRYILSEESFNFYIHLARYSDSQYHTVYHKNEYYLTFGKTSITPKVKRALTSLWLINPHLFYVWGDTTVFGGGGGRNKTMSVMRFHAVTLQWFFVTMGKNKP